MKTVYRKNYNAEWGKRVERQLAQIKKRQTSVETKQDSDDDDVSIVNQIQAEIKGQDKGIKSMSWREADETAKFGEVQRWSTDSEVDEVPITQILVQALKKTKETTVETKSNSELIGAKVARDFGEQGVFVGEIVALEYDTDDEAKEAPFYVVKCTDGDQEDLDQEELTYALELYFHLPTKKE